jgi:hypothetical protein
VCLTEEDSGMLLLSVAINFLMCGPEGGKGSKGDKNGTVDSEQGWKFASSYKEPPFQISRGYIFTFINITHAILSCTYLFSCIFKNIFSPLQVENKPHDRIITYVYSWLNGRVQVRTLGF